MIWGLGLTAPFFVFAALIGFLERARRSAPPLVQVQSIPRDVEPRPSSPKAQEPIKEAINAVQEPQSPFDKLRLAMDSYDGNIFSLLLTALDELVTVGRALKVRALCSNHYILHVDLYLQDRCSAEQEFSALEDRLRSFKTVASMTSTNASAATKKDLFKLLHAIGV